MFYDTSTKPPGMEIDPVKALVVRPIGWISTVAKDGKANLAPYSFFNLISEKPYRVMFGTSGFKDTIRNIQENSEFVVNIASYELRQALNVTSTPVAYDVDEFDLAELEKAAGQLVKVPHIAKSPARLECVLEKIYELDPPQQSQGNWMVVGKIVGVYIEDRFIVEGRVDSGALEMIVRLGYADYATVSQTWRMKRPDVIK